MRVKLYKIKITEILQKIITIKAQNYNEAYKKVKEKYYNEETVLDYDDFIEVNFSDINKIDQDNEKHILIKEIVDYLYYDEKKHYEELNKPDSHIYLKLEKLKTLID